MVTRRGNPKGGKRSHKCDKAASNATSKEPP